MRMVDKELEEDRRKAVIMGTPREKASAFTYMAWDDRVARELGISYHKVKMKDYEELARRGFKGRRRNSSRLILVRLKRRGLLGWRSGLRSGNE